MHTYSVQETKDCLRFKMLQQLTTVVAVFVYVTSVPTEVNGCRYYRSGHSVTQGRVKRQTECDITSPYRSADGTCNNINNPSWGAGNETYQRLLDPVFDDGVKLPRLKSVTGNYLKSPRDISSVIHDFDFSRPNLRGTVMLMEWGQFLSHDVAETPETDKMAVCCYDELVTGKQLHPDVMNGGRCFPIIISEGDRQFTSISSRCMNFVRSLGQTNSKGRREQVNLVSAFIDGSHIYGSFDEGMTDLRTDGGRGAKLSTYVGTNNLPEDSTSEKDCVPGNDYCMKAGDLRVNMYPGLGALHTIFMRYHNYLVDQLAAKHPTYSNEILFQQARKIVIAIMQIITYQEYLPKIIGSDTIQKNGINTTWSYNSSCDAALYNVFPTAAFRFGHSTVPDALLINGVNVSSIDLFYNPFNVIHQLDSLIQGMVTMLSERVDRWYSKGMTDHLFEEKEQGGKDIASLNIQRGRDHGIPPYNNWREFCGLKRLASFSDIAFPDRFKQVYENVNDIDLYSGALSETPSVTGGGVVGETYACLLGRQFANLRKCDRFFYENPSQFTVEQLRNLQGVRLSHVICRTTGIASIQPNVFSPPGALNTVISCTKILSQSLDISRLF